MVDIYLGFDIGGTKSAVVVARPIRGQPDMLARLEMATCPEQGWEKALSELTMLADQALAQCGLEAAHVSSVGISCGGPLDAGAGVLLGPPNLPGWDQVPIGEYLGNRYDCPWKLLNDANACALAEWRWGAGKGTRHLVFLTFGTGLGAGLVLNGRLYEGACGLAGEVGHVRLAADGPEGYGKRGSFEGFCSGGGLARAAAMLQPEFTGEITARSLAERARAGDPTAQAVFEQCGRYLGQGLAMLLDTLNPEVIVIGSVFARAYDLIWPHAAPVIDAEALPAAVSVCRVKPAELGDALGDHAAVVTAMEALRR